MVTDIVRRHAGAIKEKFKDIESSERILKSGEYIPLAIGGRTLVEQDYRKDCLDFVNLLKDIDGGDLEESLGDQDMYTKDRIMRVHDVAKRLPGAAEVVAYA